MLPVSLSILLIMLTLFAPSLVMSNPPEPVVALNQLKPLPPLSYNEDYIWGGPYMAGVLIVGDEEQLEQVLPSIHLDSFVQSVKNGRFEENYQNLVTPVPPDVSFAFIASLQARNKYLYIAPSKIIQRDDVLLWKVFFEDWYEGTYWKRIIHAEPLITRDEMLLRSGNDR
jgi:hypothetical protein